MTWLSGSVSYLSFLFPIQPPEQGGEFGDHDADLYDDVITARTSSSDVPVTSDDVSAITAYRGGQVHVCYRGRKCVLLTFEGLVFI